jgi:hypothetical protein
MEEVDGRQVGTAESTFDVQQSPQARRMVIAKRLAMSR